MPRSSAGSRGQAPSSGDQGIRRVLQPSKATPGDWAEDSGGDLTPASLAEARKAHRRSRPQWIEPRLPACCVSLQPFEQLRTGFRLAQEVGAMATVAKRGIHIVRPLLLGHAHNSWTRGRGMVGHQRGCSSIPPHEKASSGPTSKYRRLDRIRIRSPSRGPSTADQLGWGFPPAQRTREQDVPNPSNPVGDDPCTRTL